MELTIILPEGGNDMLSIIFFSAMGAIYGWLFKEIGILKIIALIVFTPAIYQFLVETENLIMVTLPFVIAAFLNYYGIRKISRFFEDLYYRARQLWERLS